MSDPHGAPSAETGHAEHEHNEHITDKTFFRVFLVLFVCTALSFITNQALGHESAIANFIIIIAIAICKAALVVLFFMHLKIDWRKVFVFVVPTMILAPLIVIVLWPDIVLAWRLVTPP
jgi:caa(3)-type oxidase subunit IV